MPGTLEGRGIDATGFTDRGSASARRELIVAERNNLHRGSLALLCKNFSRLPVVTREALKRTLE